METVVIVTASVGRPSQAVRAARAAGFRVSLRDLAGPLDEVALEGPDVIVLEPADATDLRAAVAALTSPPGMEDVPVLAVLADAALARVGPSTPIADFCLLPLRDAELITRIRRLVRRAGRSDDDTVRVDELIIDLRGYEASVRGAPLDLTYQEFELLKFLATHPGQAYSRDQLLARVWGYDYYGGSRTVDIHVRRIRAKLGHRYASCLKTIRHVGYKWVVAPDNPSEEPHR